ncbi:hypothetical protein CAL18_14715 [Bordetella genomosp. 7]|uniref:SMP-30/gluconolactonase/LRE family protein n=1 Tax=Bordetella genomosp. 7 TaxID=1416805 RepID=UPI000B9E7717|nr:SMP-30/gluconolactonase/LRE family protein [Bordetella genomosp. 7]OZI17381.1 hypothetical protein CAL18_14715 [Bordetella genomosp. 7]
MSEVPVLSPGKPVGRDLARPESVLALPDGSIVVSDRRALACHISPDGTQALMGGRHGLPNGLALLNESTLVIADIGHRTVFALSADGNESTLHATLADGSRLGAANFPLVGPDGALWLSVSTTSDDLGEAINQPRPDGQLLRSRGGRLEVVSAGLYFPNEFRFDHDGAWVYVAETTKGRIRRARLLRGGTLGDWETYGPDPVYAGAYVDGVAFDDAGNLWVTELTRNAILAISPDRRLHCLAEDPQGAQLYKPTSIAFQGSDRCSVLVGSLKSAQLRVFRSTVPGR